MPFVTKHERLRTEFQNKERDLTNREAVIKKSEEDLRNRTKTLESDETALADLMNEAQRPKQEFENLRQECLGLHERVIELTEQNRIAAEKSEVARGLLRQRITNEKQKRKEAVDDAAAARGELSDLKESNEKLSRNFNTLSARYAQERELLETEQNTASTLRMEKTDLSNKNRKLLQEKNTLLGQLTDSDKKVTSLSNTNVKLKDEIKRFKERISQQQPASFSLTDIDLLGALSEEVSELFLPPTEIVTLGSGSLDEDDFDDYLKSLGITPCAHSCSWIIVGREDWTEEQLNELLDDADLDEIRVFSQEMFIAGILTTRDPFSLPLDILMKFADGHPALEYLMNSGFEWPVIILEEDYGEPVYLRGSYERVEQSPLFRMGYQVGITHGQPRSTRRSLLNNAFKGEIPDVEDDDYMEEWGNPRQSKRLWRIAHHIAWLIRSRQTIPSMGYAVKDWQDDLNWMEKQFYTKRMRFKWPGETTGADQVSDEVAALLRILSRKALTASECMKRLKLSHLPSLRADYLQPALAAGLIEHTIPAKPQSRLQKYRLTPKGRALL